MNWISLTGSLAAILTTTAYLPQAWRAWRTRSTHDVSLKMYAIMVSGTALWLLYGLMLMDWPLIGANSILPGADGIHSLSENPLRLRFPGCNVASGPTPA